MNKTYRWGIDPDTENLVIEDQSAMRQPSYYTFTVSKHFPTGLHYLQPVDRLASKHNIHFVETEDAPNPEMVLGIIEAARKAKTARIAELVKTV